MIDENPHALIDKLPECRMADFRCQQCDRVYLLSSERIVRLWQGDPYTCKFCSQTLEMDDVSLEQLKKRYKLLKFWNTLTKIGMAIFLVLALIMYVLDSANDRGILILVIGSVLYSFIQVYMVFVRPAILLTNKGVNLHKAGRS